MRLAFWGALLTMGILKAGFTFSGEDPVLGNPWYHESITREGARAVGFSASACSTVAWHADQVDSYLYNPVFWSEGGLPRYKVVIDIAQDLSRLHFDDLFSTEEVVHMWNRYMAGTLIGVLRALEKDDVAAAQHVIGVSCHALQDLYSHSNWVDEPSRRTRTWFEVPASEKLSVFLWTGSYELPEELGILPHGKLAPVCAILNSPQLPSEAMDVICSAISPLNTLTLCVQYDNCKDSQTETPNEILEIQIPDNVMYFSPPGIALDSRWTSRIGIQVRGLDEPGLTGDSLFSTALELATRTTTQWLTILETVLASQPGGEAFWSRIQGESTMSDKEHEYESYKKRYFQYLTAGPYPPDSNQDDKYYLQVRLKTGTVSSSGTDADIYLKAEGNAFLLDHCERQKVLLNYNDFESGDDDAYVVGPFDSLPSQINIENRVADVDDLMTSLYNSFSASVNQVVDNLESYFLQFIGGNADIVASNKLSWSGDSLKAIGTNPSSFEVRLDGGDEGDYKVNLTIKLVSSDRDSSTYSVKLTTLHCLDESDWDRGTSSDEPFVLALLCPLPGKEQKHLAGPYSDVDRNEKRSINYTFQNITIPVDAGALSIVLVAMESDDESASARQKILDELGARVASGTQDEDADFIELIGTALGPDWYLEEIEVFAFRRDPDTPASGDVLKTPVNAWIEGGQSRTFHLNGNNLTEWSFNIPELSEPVAVRRTSGAIRNKNSIQLRGRLCILYALQGMEAKVFTCRGRQIYHRQFQAQQVSRIELPPGTYLISMRHGDGTVEQQKMLIGSR